ncbi:MAG: T9SS type A sorting domain-containing protein, partial [Pedobacter sp.]
NLLTTGAGSFNQAAGGTLTMTGAGKTISGTGISLNNLHVAGTASLSSALAITGDLSVTGGFTANAGTVTMSGTSKSISGAGSKSFSTLSITGSITTAADFNITSGLSVLGSFTATGGTATFSGSSTLSGTANLHNVSINGTKLQLTTNSVLGISASLSITAGSLDVVTTTPNTVNFNGTGSQNINGIAYNRLILSNGGNKTAVAAITVNEDILIGSGTTFTSGNYTHAIYKNWTNNGTFVAGTGTILFTGTATSNVNGATTFNILTLDHVTDAASVVLQSDISAVVVNMTRGKLLTGTNTATITSTRTGNGIILGNIKRTHAFVANVSYAFESPYNTIRFASVSGVSSVTVSVAPITMTDFPNNASVHREYNVLVTAGTYNATLQLHYEDDELHGNVESNIGLWRFNSPTWTPVGKTGNNTTSNYVEQSGVTNLNGRWTLSDNSNVVQWNGSISSDWNTPGNWTVTEGSASRPPGPLDIVILGNAVFNHHPTISTVVSVKKIAFASTKAVNLTLTTGGSLTTAGTIDGTWDKAMVHTLNVNDQTLTVNDLNLGDTINGRSINLNLGSGTITTLDGIRQSGGANITVTGTGTIKIYKDYEYISGNFIAGNGTVEYNGNLNQAIGPVIYNHLTVNKTSGIAFTNNSTTINGNLLVGAGEIHNQFNTIIKGNVTVAIPGILQNEAILRVGGNWVNNGTYISGPGAVYLNGSGTQTISKTTFENLIIEKPVGSVVKMESNITLKGNWIINSGSFDVGTFSCQRLTMGGTFILNDSATYITAGNSPPLNFSTYTISRSSTVIYNGTSSQTINLEGVTLGNVILRNAGQKTLASNIAIGGDFTIENGSNLTVTTHTILLEGNWKNSGTFNRGTGTVLFNGVGKTITGNTTFSTAIIGGSYTQLSDITYDNLLHVTQTGSISSGTDIFTTMNGDLMNLGSLITYGTTTYSGLRVQKLSLINATTFALIVNFNGSVSPILNSTSVPQFGYININNTGGLKPSVDWTIEYNMTVGSGASFYGGNSSHTMKGSVLNNGTITSDGTINFIPSTAATINFGTHFSSTGLLNFGGNGAITVQGTPEAMHDVVISNQNISGVSPASSWHIDSNLTIENNAVFNAGSATYTIGGNLVNTGTINAASSRFILDGDKDQRLSSVSNLNNITINKTGGNALLFNDLTVTNKLQFLKGNITTGNYKVILPGAGMITGAGQLQGWVNGNLRKHLATGATTFTYEVGDQINYTPASISFSNVTMSGQLTVASVPGQHPNTSGSDLNNQKNVNRYWSLINSGIVFDNYTATLHFKTTDVDAGAIPLQFGVDVYNGSSWSLSTIESRTDTSIKAIGISRIGDIAIGEVCNAGTTISYAGTPYCLNSGVASVVLTGTTGGLFTASGGLAINATTGEIMLANSNAGTFTITYTVAATASCPIYTTSTTIIITKPTQANILYESSPYFAGTTTIAEVTFSGTEGGRFTSAAGLVIDSLTGAINVPASVAGSYSVTYSLQATGGCAPLTTTANVVIFSKKTWDGGAGTVNWGDGNNWNPNGVPLISEDIELDGAFMINVNVAGVTKSLTLNQPSLVLTTKAGNTLSVAGDFNLMSGTFNTETTMPSVSGAVNISGGTVGYTGAATQTIVALNYNNLTSSSTGQRILPGTGSIGVRGLFTPGSNPYTINGSTIDFNGTGDQLIPAINYHHLTLSNAGIKTVRPGKAGVAGVLTIAGSAVLNTATTAATISYNGETAQNVTPTAYYSLDISTSNVVDLSSNVTVNKFSMTSGTLNLKTFSLLSSDTALYNGGKVINGTIHATGKLATFSGSILNGDVNANCSNIYLNGSTFNGTSSINKNGAAINTSTGGNVFNGVTTITNSSSGSLDLANTAPETFNADLTLNITGTSRIQLGISSENNLFNGNVTINHGGNTVGTNTLIARNNTSSATFNGNLILNCTNTNAGSGIIIANDGRATINGNIIVSGSNGRGILFGAATGTVTLANGFTITAGDSFTSGTLTLNKFIQAGNTSQQITLTGTANLLVGVGSKFDGAVIFSAPQIFLNDAEFNATSHITKTGATDNISVGGNTFRGTAVITNTGTGIFRLAGTRGDFFKANATFTQLGSGVLQPAHKGTTSIERNLSTTGSASEISFGLGGGIMLLNGSVKQTIEGPVSPRFSNLRIENSGDTVRPQLNLLIDANLTVAGGVFDLGLFTANRSTPGGVLTLSNTGQLRIGGTNTLPAYFTTHDIGANSTVDYAGVNQTIAPLNSLQLYGNLRISGTAAKLAADVMVRNNLSVPGSFDIYTHKIKIGGTLTSSGNFAANEGAVEMNGINTQHIPAGAFTGNLLKELVINNNMDVILAGTLNISDVLRVNNGQFNTGGHLVLRSTSTGTARVAEILSTALQPIIGNVTAERYIPGKRKYRLLTSSVTTFSGNTLSAGQEHLSIWGNWQNQGNNVSGNGTLITGGTSADGYDTQTGNSSLFTYDDVNRAYRRFASANGNATKYTPLKAGVAYYMFVYGDRLNTVTTSNPNNTTLKSYGTLLTGDQVYSPSSEIPLSDVPGRYTMLGNPFAAPINWATVLKTNISNTYWGWDPNLSSTGGYVTVSTAGSVTIIAPFSGATGIDQYIQPGQGIFVRTTATAPRLTIREGDKVANFNPHAFSMVQTLGTGTPKKLPLMAINLQYNSGSTSVLADGVVAAFDAAFSGSITDEDAQKMMNTAEAISIFNASTVLSIDARPLPTASDTVKLQMARITKAQYTLQIFSKHMENSTLQPYLEDNFLKTSQILSVRDTNYIPFSVSAVAASSAPDRFQIVFRAPLVLATKFVSVKAVAKNSDIEVEWEIADDRGHETYEVHRSTDGNNFTTVARINSNATGNYKWLDENVSSNNTYYRIKAINQGADHLLSKTVSVKRLSHKPSVRIYPIPVIGYRMNLEINDVQKGNYQMRITNTQGQVVQMQDLEHTGGQVMRQISVNRSIKPGVYFVRIHSATSDTIHKIFIE